MSKPEEWQMLRAYGVVTEDRKLCLNRIVVYREDGTVEMAMMVDEDELDGG
ncbi:hypothetical protein J2Z48_000257 [Croceifilum oryzae]|uniref:Uncharacterized protein n=1 Tax=Croceifilum oryzae TaxID=1553429 RepID=A0AAJ1TCP6_9BACL|nr:hypothetical protein [Croceifilum oryzae]MDQ0416099.1 hypothetical protein [Croceifilum oryzae]